MYPVATIPQVWVVRFGSTMRVLVWSSGPAMAGGPHAGLTWMVIWPLQGHMCKPDLLCSTLPNVLFHFCIHTLFLCWAQYQAPFCYSQKMWSLVFVVFKMDIPRVELAVVKVAVLLHVLCFVPEKWRSVQWGGGQKWPSTLQCCCIVVEIGMQPKEKGKENLTIWRKHTVSVHHIWPPQLHKRTSTDSKTSK